MSFYYWHAVDVIYLFVFQVSVEIFSGPEMRSTVVICFTMSSAL